MTGKGKPKPGQKRKQTGDNDANSSSSPQPSSDAVHRDVFGDWPQPMDGGHTRWTQFTYRFSEYVTSIRAASGMGGSQCSEYKLPHATWLSVQYNGLRLLQSLSQYNKAIGSVHKECGVDATAEELKAATPASWMTIQEGHDVLVLRGSGQWTWASVSNKDEDGMIVRLTVSTADDLIKDVEASLLESHVKMPAADGNVPAHVRKVKEAWDNLKTLLGDAQAATKAEDCLPVMQAFIQRAQQVSAEKKERKDTLEKAQQNDKAAQERLKTMLQQLMTREASLKQIRDDATTELKTLSATLKDKEKHLKTVSNTVSRLEAMEQKGALKADAAHELMTSRIAAATTQFNVNDVRVKIASLQDRVRALEEQHKEVQDQIKELKGNKKARKAPAKKK